MASMVRRFVALGASLHASRVGRRFRRPGVDQAAQEATWGALRSGYSASLAGRADGIHRRMTYEEFRARVPLRDYEALVPAIERMKRGEADILWPGRCAYFAVSSGTTAGRTKFLPVNAAMLAHFRQTGLESLCLYAQRAGHARVFRGRHLFLGGSTALSPLPEAHPFAAWTGDLSGIAAANLPGWVRQHLYEPGSGIAQMADWPAKIRAIAEQTACRDISLVAGIPSWLLILAAELRRQTGCGPLDTLWPNLECLVHGGVPVGPFAEELRAEFGQGIRFHEVYPASEAFIAAQDAEPGAGLRLLARAGILYEFLPLARFDPARLPELGAEAVPLAGVQAGTDYVLVLSTPGGLCRYVIGDVVRFVTTEPARLVYVGRTRLQLSAFGEHVIEHELTETLAEVAAVLGGRVVNFHVAPLFTAGSGRRRGRHEWWIELRGPAAPEGAPARWAAELDACLQRRNDDYEAKRQGGGLDLPAVRLVPEGTFEIWLRSRGKWGGQNKMPRCRSDRMVADELASCEERLARRPAAG
jgi:hypothetical protein